MTRVSNPNAPSTSTPAATKPTPPESGLSQSSSSLPSVDALTEGQTADGLLSLDLAGLHGVETPANEIEPEWAPAEPSLADKAVGTVRSGLGDATKWLTSKLGEGRDHVTLPATLVESAVKEAVPAETLRSFKVGDEASAKLTVVGTVETLGVACEAKLGIGKKLGKDGAPRYVTSVELKALPGLQAKSTASGTLGAIRAGTGVKVEHEFKTPEEAQAHLAKMAVLSAEGGVGLALGLGTAGASALLTAAAGAEFLENASTLELSGLAVAALEYDNLGVIAGLGAETSTTLVLELQDGDVASAAVKAGGKLEGGVAQDKFGVIAASSKGEISVELQAKRVFDQPVSLDGAVSGKTPLFSGGSVELSAKTTEAFRIQSPIQDMTLFAKYEQEAKMTVSSEDLKAIASEAGPDLGAMAAAVGKRGAASTSGTLWRGDAVSGAIELEEAGTGGLVGGDFKRATQIWTSKPGASVEQVEAELQAEVAEQHAADMQVATHRFVR